MGKIKLPDGIDQYRGSVRRKMPREIDGWPSKFRTVTAEYTVDRQRHVTIVLDYFDTTDGYTTAFKNVQEIMNKIKKYEGI